MTLLLAGVRSGSPGSQPGHGKVSFRQRAAGEAAAAAAAGSSAAAQQPAHATVGGLGKIHPHAPTKQQPADSGVEDTERQQAAAGEAGEAAAAAAAASGRSLGPSQAAAAAAAAAAGGEAPRVKGSGPQLDMMTGRLAGLLLYCQDFTVSRDMLSDGATAVKHLLLIPVSLVL